jgi:hypothetical protein
LNESTRVRHIPQRRGGMAAHCACTAAGDAGDRVAY